jgi:hypothetical protein
MKKKRRKPDAKAGTLGVCFGVAGLAMALLFPHNSGESPGSRYSLAGFSLILLGWGSRQIAAARKMESRGAEDASGKDEDQVADEYVSGSMHNVFILFGWVLLFVAAVAVIGLGYLFLFHHTP